MKIEPTINRGLWAMFVFAAFVFCSAMLIAQTGETLARALDDKSLGANANWLTNFWILATTEDWQYLGLAGGFLIIGFLLADLIAGGSPLATIRKLWSRFRESDGLAWLMIICAAAILLLGLVNIIYPLWHMGSILPAIFSGTLIDSPWFGYLLGGTWICLVIFTIFWFQVCRQGYTEGWARAEDGYILRMLILADIATGGAYLALVSGGLIGYLAFLAPFADLAFFVKAVIGPRAS